MYCRQQPPPASLGKKVGPEVFYPRKVTAKCLTHKRLRMSEPPKGFVSYLVIPVTIIPEYSLVMDHNDRCDNLWPGYHNQVLQAREIIEVWILTNLRYLHGLNVR